METWYSKNRFVDLLGEHIPDDGRHHDSPAWLAAEQFFNSIWKKPIHAKDTKLLLDLIADLRGMGEDLGERPGVIGDRRSSSGKSYSRMFLRIRSG